MEVVRHKAMWCLFRYVFGASRVCNIQVRHPKLELEADTLKYMILTDSSRQLCVQLNKAQRMIWNGTGMDK
jgi:hypothetical protein